jgi:outer membrane protein insertion porin family
VGISQNSTDDLFSPTKGGKIKGHLTYMGLGFQSRYHYFRAETQINRYLEIFPKWILAGKIRMGFIQSLKENQSTPIEDRFLIGGASSLRGWGRHQISPVNQAGNIIGGNSMLETSIELRFPIYDIFSGVLFTDIGNVWRNTFNYDMTQLNYNAGLGFRVSTPIGPVRLDMATPVFDEPFRLQLFISIGHAF